MAAFIAKQMVGNQLSAVKDMGGGESLTPEEKERLAQLEQERLEALREQEDRRKEKHRKLEEEREKMRKGIRDKYNIKKKEHKISLSKEESLEITKQDSVCSEGGLNRRKKTPEEMAAEAEEADLDDFTKFKNSLEHRISELKNTIETRCVLQ